MNLFFIVAVLNLVLCCFVYLPFCLMAIEQEEGLTRSSSNGRAREYLRGKYYCTVDLLFDWFGLACFANKNKNCQL
jgi:hypothetical protein